MGFPSLKAVHVGISIIENKMSNTMDIAIAARD
jgi:hypothetical protein